jgi:hypothetical protein
MESLSTQVIVAFTFGIVFVVALMLVAFAFPNPTSFQYTVFRIVLSLAAAGVAAMIPGFINIEVNRSAELIIRAGGALAVFVIVFFFNPANFALQIESSDRIAARVPTVPDKLPSGDPFPTNKHEAFNNVWQALIALESAGQALWLHVSSRTLVEFADKYRQANEHIQKNALFFSDEDYRTLKELIRAANFYLDGKTKLANIRGTGQLDGSRGKRYADEVKKQIQQNKRWLTRYKNVLLKIRTNLYTVAHQ